MPLPFQCIDLSSQPDVIKFSNKLIFKLIIYRIIIIFVPL